MRAARHDGGWGFGSDDGSGVLATFVSMATSRSRGSAGSRSGRARAVDDDYYNDESSDVILPSVPRAARERRGEARLGWRRAGGGRNGGAAAARDAAPDPARGRRVADQAAAESGAGDRPGRQRLGGRPGRVTDPRARAERRPAATGRGGTGSRGRLRRGPRPGEAVPRRRRRRTRSSSWCAGSTGSSPKSGSSSPGRWGPPCAGSGAMRASSNPIIGETASGCSSSGSRSCSPGPSGHAWTTWRARASTA